MEGFNLFNFNKRLFGIMLAVMVSNARAQTVEASIPQHALPGEIKDSFSMIFPVARDVSWAKESDLFVAHWIEVGKDEYAYFTKNGFLRERGMGLTETELPSSIQNIIKAKFKSDQCVKTTKIEEGGLIYFKIEAITEAKTEILFLDRYGRNFTKIQ